MKKYFSLETYHAVYKKIIITLASLLVLFLIITLVNIQVDNKKIADSIQEKFDLDDVIVRISKVSVSPKVSLSLFRVKLKRENLFSCSAQKVTIDKAYSSLLKPHSITGVKSIDANYLKIILSKKNLASERFLPDLLKLFLDSEDSISIKASNTSVYFAKKNSKDIHSSKNLLLLANKMLVNYTSNKKKTELDSYFTKDKDKYSIFIIRDKKSNILTASLKGEEIFSVLITHNLKKMTGKIELSVFDPLKFSELMLGRFNSLHLKNKISNNIYLKVEYKYDNQFNRLEFKKEILEIFGTKAEEFKLFHTSNNELNVTIDARDIVANIVRIASDSRRSSSRFHNSDIALKKSEIFAKIKKKNQNNTKVHRHIIPLMQFMPTTYFSKVNLDFNFTNLAVEKVMDIKSLNTKILIKDSKAIIDFKSETSNITLEAEGFVDDIYSEQEKTIILSVKAKQTFKKFFELLKFPKIFTINTDKFLSSKLNHRQKIDGSFWLIGNYDFIVLDNFKFVLSDDTFITGRTSHIDHDNSLDFDVSLFNMPLNYLSINVPNVLTDDGDMFSKVYLSTLGKHNHIQISCLHCYADSKLYDLMELSYSTSNGKVDLKKLTLLSDNLKLKASGLVSIASDAPKANLFVHLFDWDGQPSHLGGLIPKFNSIIIPSFEGFSGKIRLYGDGIKLGKYKIREASLSAEMRNGFITIADSNLSGKRVDEEDNLLSNEIASVFDGFIDYSLQDHRYHLTFAANGLGMEDLLDHVLGGQYQKSNFPSGIVGLSGSISSSGSEIAKIIPSAKVKLKIFGDNLSMKGKDLNSLGLLFSSTNNNPFMRMSRAKINGLVSDGARNIYSSEVEVTLDKHKLTLDSANFIGNYSSISFVGSGSYYNKNNFNWNLIGRSIVTAVDLSDGIDIQNTSKQRLGYIYGGYAYSGSSEQTKIKSVEDRSQFYKYIELRKVLNYSK